MMAASGQYVFGFRLRWHVLITSVSTSTFQLRLRRFDFDHFNFNFNTSTSTSEVRLRQLDSDFKLSQPYLGFEYLNNQISTPNFNFNQGLTIQFGHFNFRVNFNLLFLA